MSFFDCSLLEGYLCYKATEKDMRSIFSSELNANKREFHTPDANRFYNHVMEFVCKKSGCDCEPTWKPLVDVCQ